MSGQPTQVYEQLLTKLQEGGVSTESAQWVCEPILWLTAHDETPTDDVVVEALNEHFSTLAWPTDQQIAVERAKDAAYGYDRGLNDTQYAFHIATTQADEAWIDASAASALTDELEREFLDHHIWTPLGDALQNHWTAHALEQLTWARLIAVHSRKRPSVVNPWESLAPLLRSGLWIDEESWVVRSGGTDGPAITSMPPRMAADVNSAAWRAAKRADPAWEPNPAVPPLPQGPPPGIFEMLQMTPEHPEPNRPGSSWRTVLLPTVFLPVWLLGAIRTPSRPGSPYTLGMVLVGFGATVSVVLAVVAAVTANVVMFLVAAYWVVGAGLLNAELRARGYY